MARPRKDGMDYFPHDTDALNDEKLEALRLLYGNDGYAFYFILLERIYRTNDGELDVSDAETKQILSKKVAVTEQKFDRMLETSLKRGCFDKERYESEGVLTSNGIKKRMSVVVEKRIRMRNQYTKKVSDAETRQKPDKVKESKVKESKDKRASKKFDDNHMKLAKVLYKKIQENNSNAKEPNFDTWANTFRLMMERDKRDGKEIQQLILWTQQHHFWYKNILSADKLRKQYDRLLLEMKDDGKFAVISGGGNNAKHKTSYESDSSKYDFSKRRGL